MATPTKLSPPPAASTAAPADPPHSAERHTLIRERTFPSSADIDYVVTLLRRARSTGTLLIDISQGGVNNVRFREEHRIAYDSE